MHASSRSTSPLLAWGRVPLAEAGPRARLEHELAADAELCGRGDTEQALVPYSRALRLAHRGGIMAFSTLALCHLAFVWEALDEPGQARRCLVLGVVLSRLGGNAWWEAVCFSQLAGVEERAGDISMARADWVQAEQLHSRLGDAGGTHVAHAALARLERLRWAA